MSDYRVGDRVRVPLGISQWVEGTVIDVWGDPPEFIRVQYWFGKDPEELYQPLLSPEAVEPLPPAPTAGTPEPAAGPDRTASSA